MVDVGSKPTTSRMARAAARVQMTAETLKLIQDRKFAKGDVFEVARLAGIMGTKRTADLIPLCHPLPIDSVTVDFEVESETVVRIIAEVAVTAKTGVEMEALVAASTAALTIYDMCKAVDRAMHITDIRLVHKAGGKSGIYEAD